MHPPASRRKLTAFYALTVTLALLVALALLEVILRQLAFTNAVDVGSRAQKRWTARHWKPFNEGLYRDLPIAVRLTLDQPKIYFLGDSFTAGAGVTFEEGYYFRTAWEPPLGLNAFNLSRPGATTRQQLAEIRRFNAHTGSRASVVVHQYFMNDIEDHVTLPPWKAPAWLDTAGRHLDTAELLKALLFNREWGGQFKAAMKAAYADPATMARHLGDVRELHDYIRNQGGKVVLLAFPALNSDELMRDSGPVLRQLRKEFAANCRPGEVYLDVTGLAEPLDQGERIVSWLDPHPSPELHALIATALRQALFPGAAAAQEGPPPYETCEALRRAP